MKAALIYGPRDVRLQAVDDPSIQKDEVLVKVHACGICGTDIHTYRVGDASMSEKPVMPGHEFSGEIVEMGSAVEGLSVGERVIGTGLRNCGECYWCRQGQTERCPYPSVPGEGLDGAIAEYVVVPNPMLGIMFFHIPENMHWEEAATVEPVAVSCYAVKRARIQLEETVVVLGAGMIGLCVAQACKAMGAKVIISEPSNTRRNMAKNLGADAVFNPLETDPVEAVIETTSAEMAGVVFECSGAPIAFHQAPLLVRPFGRMMQIGMYEKNLELTPELMTMMFQYRNLTLYGCGGQRWDIALELMQAGKVKTKDLITHVFSLDDVKDAFEMQLNSDDAIKVLVKP